MKAKRGDIRMIIAGGGTGGHLFPGVAVARELGRRYERADILFVTGKKRMETEILGRLGFQQMAVSVEGLKGRGWKKGAMVLAKLPLSFFQAISIIRGFGPHLVLGVGGYSSGPVCLAARVLGIPTAIHEQNSYPGLTNRLLCRLVDRVFVSFETSQEHVSGNALLTGNPVRDELLRETDEGPVPQGGFTVLVLGGSQGARAINRGFVEAMEILKKRGRKLSVIHQAGAGDFGYVIGDYERKGLQGEIMPFIEDMKEAYRRADLVVSRAGATTVSELAAMGKPSILIPYPFAANRHQELNASALVLAGGAVMRLEEELKGSALADLIMTYMDDRQALREMGQRARSVGRPHAARIIVDHLLELL